MTHKEAVNVLEDMKVKISIPKAAELQHKRNEAIDMAIKVLNCSEFPNNSAWRKGGRMSDLISRQDAIDAIEKLHIPEDMCVFEILSHIELAIGALPSAEPERKKGKWEYHSNPNIRGGMNPEDAYCSVCGFHIYTPEVDNFDDYNYCPDCGSYNGGEK